MPDILEQYDSFLLPVIGDAHVLSMLTVVVLIMAAGFDVARRLRGEEVGFWLYLLFIPTQAAVAINTSGGRVPSWLLYLMAVTFIAAGAFTLWVLLRGLVELSSSSRLIRLFGGLVLTIEFGLYFVQLTINNIRLDSELSSTTNWESIEHSAQQYLAIMLVALAVFCFYWALTQPRKDHCSQMSAVIYHQSGGEVVDGVSMQRYLDRIISESRLLADHSATPGDGSEQD